MIAVEIKGRNPKSTWEVVGIYKSSKRGQACFRQTSSANSLYRELYRTQHYWGDLNLPYVDWNGNAGGNSGTQALINSLVWENGYSQLVGGPTRGDALLDVFLVRPDSSVTYRDIVQGLCDHQAVILEVKWKDTCNTIHVERLVPIYKKHMSQVYKPSFEINMEYGQATGRALRFRKTQEYSTRKHETFCATQNTQKNSDPEYYNRG